MALWPLIAVPGGAGFAPLTGLAAILTAHASLPRIRPRLYTGAMLVFFVFAAASSTWSPFQTPVIDLSKGVAVSEVPRIALLLLAAGALIAATQALNASRAQLIGRIAVIAFLVQVVIVVVLTIFERQAIEFFYPGRPDDEGVQNISRNCLIMAAAFPFLAISLTEGRHRILGLIAVVLILAAESTVLLYRGVHAGLLAIAAAAICYTIVRLAPRQGFRIIGALIVLAIMSAPFIFQFISAGVDAAGAASSMEYRQLIWARVLEIIHEDPLLGQGVGALRSYQERIPEGFFEGELLIPNHPHNMALQLWAELGLAGVAILSIAIMLAAFRLPKPVQLSSAAPRIAMLAGVTLAIGVVSFDLWNPGWWGTVSLLAMLCAVNARTVANDRV
jgi:O-antigen ligase